LNLLLDTHIWLGTGLESERITAGVARALDSDRNELWLSPVSIWELSNLIAKGRVSLGSGLVPWVRESLVAMRLQEAPLTHDIALAASALDQVLTDPADRLIAATAKVLNLTLVTADRRLLDLRGIKTLANR